MGSVHDGRARGWHLGRASGPVWAHQSVDRANDTPSNPPGNRLHRTNETGGLRSTPVCSFTQLR